MLGKGELTGIRRQLDEMQERGARLYLEGKRATAEEILRACFVEEEFAYMPDYILDGDGRLAELRYDKIKEK